LTPTQRTVLVLCDLIEYSAREGVASLELAETNVRMLLHRACRALAANAAQRCVPSAELRARTEETLRHFLLLIESSCRARLNLRRMSADEPQDESAGAAHALCGRSPLCNRGGLRRGGTDGAGALALGA